MNDIRSQAHGAAVTIAQLEVVIHYEEKIAFYKETRDAEMEELRESNKALTLTLTLTLTRYPRARADVRRREHRSEEIQGDVLCRPEGGRPPWTPAPAPGLPRA